MYAGSLFIGDRLARVNNISYDIRLGKPLSCYHSTSDFVERNTSCVAGVYLTVF